MRFALLVVSLLLATNVVFAEKTAAVLSSRSEKMQSANLVGEWHLVSASATDGSARNDTPFGAHPSGMLSYLPDGRIMLVLTYGGRKPLASGDRVSASVAERAEAFATGFAYAGRYSIAENKVVHHVEISTVENWVNTDLVRLVQIDGDKLILTTPPIAVGGRPRVTELIWERIK